MSDNQKDQENATPEENFGGQPKPLSEKEKAVIHKLFSKYDQSRDKKLQFDEFVEFIKGCYLADLDQDPEADVNAAAEQYQPNLRQMRFIYEGMDVDGSNDVSEDEICDCFAAMKENNFKWMCKMLFRGADKDNSRKVSIAEIKDCVSMCGKQFSEEEFVQRCKIEIGKEAKELTFAQFYKVITGDTIPADTDPYDGKLKKSKCCLLL